ncbi:MAG: bifunctional metallophosphatase/5'-nucleotidase [Desulfobulbus sp.]
MSCISSLALRSLARLLLVLLLVVLPGCAVKQAEQSESTTLHLSILHTNDTHGNWGGYSEDGRICYTALCEKGSGGILRADRAIRAVRAQAPATILLDAGDQFQGTLFFTHHKEAMAAEVVNGLAYDVFVPGNHEFDDGCEAFARFVRALQVPVLAANLSFAPGTRAESKASFMPWIITKQQGWRIGLVGLVNPDTANLSSPCNEARFGAAKDALHKAIEELQAQDVKIIILITHLGLADDRQLAREVEGVDVIVGAHTHSLLSNTNKNAVGPYPIVETSPAGEPVLVVSNGYALKTLGRLEVVFNAQGVAQNWSGEPIVLNDVELEKLQAPATNPQLVEMMQRRAEPVQNMLTEPVGTIVADTGQEQALESPSILQCRIGECRSGNLVADALRQYWHGSADITLLGSGTLRNSLPAGPVSTGDIIAAIPFENNLVLAEMDGATLLAALEQGLSRYEEGKGFFLQVSGLRYSFKAENARGSRLLSAAVPDKNGTWQPVQANATYRVSTSSFQARGGDGYHMFTDLDWHDSEQNISDVVREYISTHSPLPVQLEERIIRR